MRQIGLAVMLVTVLAVSAVEAAPGDLAVVRGTLAWPHTLGQEPFVVVRADDGRYLSVDVTSAQRVTRDALAAGARLSLVGVEGARAWEVQALVLGSGDAAMSRAPLPSSPPSEPDWQRVEGVVESITGHTLVLKASDGRHIKVDVSNLNDARLLSKGDTLKVYGRAPTALEFVATGVIQLVGGSASALPKSLVR